MYYLQQAQLRLSDVSKVADASQNVPAVPSEALIISAASE